MNIYLDIDGTLIYEDLERRNQPAEGLEEFLIALRPHTVYWLTTHCMDGDPQYARALMKRTVSENLHADIDRIQPTTWQQRKTEAIDFTKDFLWLDNDVYPEDREDLRAKALKDGQWLAEVDLVANPNRLRDIVRDYLLMQH